MRTKRSELSSLARRSLILAARVVRLAILAGLICGGFPVSGQALQYPADFHFIEVADPLSGGNTTYTLSAASLPSVGAAFFDPCFGTIQTRTTQTDGINSRHEYARIDPFNVDQALILLVSDQGGANVYHTGTMPYNQAGNLVRYVDVAEPRWDHTNPALLWGLDGFKIVTMDVLTTDTKTVVKDFEQDAVLGPIIAAQPVYRITCQDEGEASTDRRYWAFMLQADDRADYQPLYLFSWDRTLDQVEGVYPLTASERSIDWVGMSPLGNYVLVGGDAENTPNTAGLTMANRAFTQFHRLTYATGHSDVGLDSQGYEVIVMQNSLTDHVDLIPIDWSTQPILESGGSYGGTGIVPLIRLYYDNESPYGLQSGVHISCNFPGYAVVSTHLGPALADRNWLDRTIVLARLNRAQPKVCYLAKIHNTTQDYWEETHAAITNDGQTVVWADNWGLNVGSDQMFLIQLDMPPKWSSLTQTRATVWEIY